MAASKGHKPAAEWLLQRGVAVNAADKDGYTALHSVCISDTCDDAAMVELLLSAAIGDTPKGLQSLAMCSVLEL
jgi:ankyrin repeat protein